MVLLNTYEDRDEAEEAENLISVVFRNLCHFSNIKKTGVTHDSIF